MVQLTQYLERKVNRYITKINKAYKKTRPYIHNKTEICANKDRSGAIS